MHKWNVDAAVETIKREKITLAGGVPFIVLQLIEAPGLQHDSPIETYTFGGAAPPASLPSLLRRQQGPGKVVSQASQAYGLTESNAVLSSHCGNDYLFRPASCGLPSPVNDFRIVGDNGEILPSQGIGEIYVRGPNIAEGYYNDEKATKESFSDDGWFRTFVPSSLSLLQSTTNAAL